MWRLFHKLFGYDYVLLQFGYTWYVKRAHKMPNGEMYVKLLSGVHILYRDLTMSGRFGKYIPLTWKG